MAAANFICSPDLGVIDPVRAHMLATNALARGLFELRQQDSAYEVAAGYIKAAQEAIEALRVAQFNEGRV